MFSREIVPSGSVTRPRARRSRQFSRPPDSMPSPPPRRALAVARGSCCQRVSCPTEPGNWDRDPSRSQDRPGRLHRPRHGRRHRRDSLGRRRRHDVPGGDAGRTGKQRGKRHPTVEDHAVIGVGASVLGAVKIGRAPGSAQGRWCSTTCRRTPQRSGHRREPSPGAIRRRERRGGWSTCRIRTGTR